MVIAYGARVVLSILLPLLLLCQLFLGKLAFILIVGDLTLSFEHAHNLKEQTRRDSFEKEVSFR